MGENRENRPWTDIPSTILKEYVRAAATAVTRHTEHTAVNLLTDLMSVDPGSALPLIPDVVVQYSCAQHTGAIEEIGVLRGMDRSRMMRGHNEDNKGDNKGDHNGGRDGGYHLAPFASVSDLVPAGAGHVYILSEGATRSERLSQGVCV